MRVLPDIVGLDRVFDYAVPDSWHQDGRAGQLDVGSIVRVDLLSRRVRGWVVDMDVSPPADVELSPLRHLTGMGPPAELIELAGWAAWRWSGNRVSLMRTASPVRSVSAAAFRYARVGAAAVGAGAAVGRRQQRLDSVFQNPRGITVLRCAPADDGLDVALAAARLGDALIVVPDLAPAGRIASGLHRSGVSVAFGFDAWARAAAGVTVVGTRKAVWMPMPRLAAVVVIDEHDEGLQEQYAVTWNARDVALERARRRGVPAVLVSPVPSLEALAAGPSALGVVDGGTVVRIEGVGFDAAGPSALGVVDGGTGNCGYGEPDTLVSAGVVGILGRGRGSGSRHGWPVVAVLDRRDEDPVHGGLFAEGFSRFLDPVEFPGRVVVVLNRKGRSRLLACRTCGELVCNADGSSPMILDDDGLVSRDGSERRPVVCSSCGSTVLRNLRIGVNRAREDMEALAGEPVGQLTSESASMPSERIVIGTEAVLRRMRSAVVVAFLDFDQELLAPRQRANLQALTLLARAARLLCSRASGGDVSGAGRDVSDGCRTHPHLPTDDESVAGATGSGQCRCQQLARAADPAAQSPCSAGRSAGRPAYGHREGAAAQAGDGSSPLRCSGQSVRSGSSFFCSRPVGCFCS